MQVNLEFRAVAFLFYLIFLITGVMSGHLSQAWANDRLIQDQSIETPASLNQDLKLGVKVDAAFRTRFYPSQHYGIDHYLMQVGKKLAAKSPVYYPFSFSLLQEDRIANAYSIPGGFVYVTSGLLNLLEDESQLAGMLASQMAHIIKRHPYRLPREYQAYIQGQNLSLEEGLPIQDEADIRKTDVDLWCEALLFESYLPEEEQTANELALSILIKAGYSPEGLLKWLSKLDQLESQGIYIAYNQTHPAHESNILALRDRLALKLPTPLNGLIKDTSQFHRLMP